MFRLCLFFAKSAQYYNDTIPLERLQGIFLKFFKKIQKSAMGENVWWVSEELLLTIFLRNQPVWGDHQGLCGRPWMLRGSKP